MLGYWFRGKAFCRPAATTEARNGTNPEPLKYRGRRTGKIFPEGRKSRKDMGRCGVILKNRGGGSSPPGTLQGGTLIFE